MTVQAQDTVFSYTGNGVSTVFAYGCKILSSDDLYVYVDDERVTSGFTMDGIGAASGGSVTFDSAPADGVDIRIERVVLLKRDTDYAQNGDFKAVVVNPDFDRLWMAAQQLQTQIGRSLKFSSGDNTASELPSPASRASNLLGFDENGKPVAVAPAAQSASALQARLAASDGARLVGFIGDAVGSVPKTVQDVIRDFFSSAGSSLIGFIQSGTGAIVRWVQDKLREYPTVKDFGGVGDGVADDTVAVSKWLTAVKEKYGSSIPAVYNTGSSPAPTIDMGGVKLDMGDGIFAITSPLDLGLMSNYTLLAPSLKALSGFSGSGLIKIYSNAGFPVTRVHIQGGFLECNWFADKAIDATDFLHLSVNDVVAQHYISAGIKTYTLNFAPHELIVNGGFYFQKKYEESYPDGLATGMAFDVNNFDNMYANVVVGYHNLEAANLQTGAQMLVNCHFYSGSTTSTSGRVIVGDVGTQIDNCYFDGTPLEISGTQVTARGNRFYVNNGGIAITLGTVPYLTEITNNTFKKDGTSTSVISMPTIAGGRTLRPEIYDNHFNGCTGIATRGRSYVNMNAASITYTLSDQFLPLSSYRIVMDPRSTNPDSSGFQFQSYFNATTNQMTVKGYTVAGAATTYNGWVNIDCNNSN